MEGKPEEQEGKLDGLLLINLKSPNEKKKCIQVEGPTRKTRIIIL